ncbi:MAG: hypothetical protein CVU44_09460 [Chloroflexi bacterium HGW-Chloroflexi-6]|nr:MAG: hypothetical protein CVU44_09460 [Chloroflexi bacterium HGW-Chloroflexi-6]
MLNRIGQRKTIFLLLMLMGVIGACNSPYTTPVQVVNTFTPSPTVDATPIPALPAETSLATETPAFSPTLAAGLPESPTESTDHAGRFKTIIVSDKDSSEILLFDSNGKAIDVYQLDGQSYTPLLAEQVSNHCGLVALVNTPTGHKLIQLDQRGEIVQEIFSLKNDDADSLRYLPMISKSGEFVAYVVYSGELYYDSAQYQDLEVVKLDDPEKPIRLSSHGGAWKEGGSWSLESDQIAFTDYDDKSIIQVYVAKIPDLERKKITDFTSQELTSGPITWSPSGNKMAVTLGSKEYGQEVWIIPLNSAAYRLNLLEGRKIAVGSVFWSKDESGLMLYVQDYSSDQSGLYWFDVTTNTLLHVLTDQDASQINPKANSFAHPFPLSSDLSEIVFYNSMGEWYLYNTNNEQIESVPWLNGQQWGSHLSVTLFSDVIAACNT